MTVLLSHICTTLQPIEAVGDGTGGWQLWQSDRTLNQLVIQPRNQTERNGDEVSNVGNWSFRIESMFQISSSSSGENKEKVIQAMTYILFLLYFIFLSFLHYYFKNSGIGIFFHFKVRVIKLWSLWSYPIASESKVSKPFHF